MNRFPRPCLAATLMLATVGAATAAEFYVNAANATGTELGTQQSPFRTVQAGITAAAAGDTIRVAAGTYVENLRIDGKALVLEGGYSGEWVRDLAKNTTTLSGAGGNAVINVIEADATIDGFRIAGGTGSTDQLPYGYHGGGIYSRDGSPTISNNIIEGNDVRSGDPPFDYNFGGGVYVTNAARATLMNNVVRGNYAGRGAGIAVFGTAALIQGNTVENNVAVGDHGGGMFIGVVNARITQNIIRGNEVGRELSYGWGGGLIVVGAGNSAEISFNTLYGNFAAAYGSAEFVDEGARADIHHELIYGNVSKVGCEAVSAISVDGGEGVGSEATIRHCTVVGNVCENSTRGNGLQVEGLSSVSVSNCIFWNNGGDDFATDGTSTLTVTYTCSQEAIAGIGNLSANPRFVSEQTADYRLAAGSPCIDAGDPASPFGNEPAPNGGRADMGRYGNTADAGASGGSTDDVADEDDGPDGPATGGSSDDAAADDAGNQATDSGDAQSDGAANGHVDGTNGSAAENASDSLSSAGLCPTASAMLLSISVIGAQRARRRRA